MNIYLGILEMVENKMKVELITFLEYHRGKINENGWSNLCFRGYLHVV